MRDLLILGSGRSGTSMVAGSMARAGYFLGERLYLPRTSNPKGFFEAPEVNGCNEALLAPMLEPVPAFGPGQRWLGVPSEGAEPRASTEVVRRIEQLVARSPWCFKDPRFSFTLPAWRPFLHRPGRPEPGLVCVFRDPRATIRSLLVECRSAHYLRNVEIDEEHARRLWLATYRTILERHAGEGDWLFVHYDQMLGPDGRQRIAAFSGAELDGEFPDPALRSHEPDGALDDECREVYEELCARAGHRSSVASRAVDVTLPRVTVVALLPEGTEARARELAREIEEQRGVDAELVLVHRGPGPTPDVVGARVVRSDLTARSQAWQVGVAAARGEWVAWTDLDTEMLPTRLRHGVDRLRACPEADWVLCDFFQSDARGQFVERVDPSRMGDAPAPYWFAGVIGTRRSFEGLDASQFRPNELALYLELRAAGRVERVAEPGFHVHVEHFRANWQAARRDATLLALEQREARHATPKLSLVIEADGDVHALGERLRCAARQPVPVGEYEIVVVCEQHDARSWEYLVGVSLRVPLMRLRVKGNPAARLQRALEAARGELVLLASSGQELGADCVEQHLEAHRRSGPAQVVVIGSIEPARGGAAHALGALLRCGGNVRRSAASVGFDASALGEGNVSFPRTAALEVGGFEAAFESGAGAAEDLGWKLALAGYGTVDWPAARTRESGPLALGGLRASELERARSRARMALAWPERVAAEDLVGVTRATLHEVLAENATALDAMEAAATEIATLDIVALEQLSPEFQEIGQAAVERLRDLVTALLPVWRAQGLLEGLAVCGLDSFDEVVACAGSSDERRPDWAERLFAWPDWSDPAALEALLSACAPMVDRLGARLVLRRDRDEDPPAERAVAELSRRFEARFGEQAVLEVELEDRVLDVGDNDLGAWWRLRRENGAALLAGGRPEFPRLARDLGWRTLEGDEDVEAWLERGCARRIEDGTGTNAGGPELSVLVPSHDRPRRVRRLLELLEHADIEPSRFEVIVVDDGSPEPLEPLLTGREWPFELRVLRQEQTGPGAARNRALEHARAELVLFLNDDAVPARTTLRRHIEAHRQSSEPRAVLGTFRLASEHRRHSFGELSERDSLLFAQPRMKPGVLYHGLSFCTGNLSVEKRFVLEAGGFDTSFPFAGGEDSELGYRLEQRFGLQVAFQPEAECEHDHDLDVRQYARRQRVLGWSVVRMARTHGDESIVRPEGGALDAAFWAAVDAEVQGTEERVEELVREVERICHHELDQDTGAIHVEAIRPLVEVIGAVEFRRGLLAARADRMPFDADQGSVGTSASRGHESAAGAGAAGATALLEPPPAPPTTTGGSSPRSAGSLEALRAMLARTEGMLEQDEAECLYQLALHLRIGAIVDVGSYRGRSAVALGLGSLDGAGLPVFAIEPHEPFVGVLGGRFGPEDRAGFYRAMLDTGCFRVVCLVNLSSEVVSPGFEHQVGLLFLDGDHTYQGVRRDWVAWAPHLRDGALVVFHGVHDPELGPSVLTDELRKAGVLDPRQSVGTLAVFRYRRPS